METTVTDIIRPFQDSDLQVQRRWYKVSEDTPLLGIPTPFMSGRYQAFPELNTGAGAVWPCDIDYTRRGTPGGIPNAHLCGTALDFQRGAVFNPSVHVVYDDEWIPECCGRMDVCTTQLCGQDQLNARPAAQLWSFPIPHQDATGETPVRFEGWALNQGAHTPAYPGWMQAYYPRGWDNDPQWSLVQYADNLGVLQEMVETIRFAPDNAITITRDATQLQVGVEQGGASGTITAKIVSGVLELCGTNLVVCKSILPPETTYRVTSYRQAFGNTYAEGPELTDGVWELIPLGLLNHAFKLVASPGVVIDCSTAGNTTYKIFPPPTDSIAGGTLGDYYTPSAPFGLNTAVRFTRYRTGLLTPHWDWAVEYYDRTGAVATGTVTSVGISSSSTGVSVNVVNPSTTPALTVNIDGSLQDVVALSSVDGLIAGDGAGGLVTVAIGAWLNYSGGTLAVTPPTATTGQSVLGASFIITAASTVWQATGLTLTLPSAGTYRIGGAIRGYLQPGAVEGQQISARLWNNTAGALVANSEVTVIGVYGATIGQATAPLEVILTVGAPAVIEVQAFRSGTAWVAAVIGSDANGRSLLTYTRLS